MYFRPAFAPISLLGLLFKEGVIAGAVPNTQVSVIVPVYNGEETIEKCIRHIQGQSIRPLEVLVVDDGSSDMTPFMLGELVKAHPNLRIIRNRENMGKAGAVTTALKHVNSPYTAIIDADTYLDPDYIKNTLGAFHGEKIVAASGMVLPSDSEDLVSSSRLIEYLHSQSTYKQIQNKMGVTFVSRARISLVSAYQGLKLGFSLKKVLRSIPYYYLLRIPTAAVFWRSIISPKRKGW